MKHIRTTIMALSAGCLLAMPALTGCSGEEENLSQAEQRDTMTFLVSHPHQTAGTRVTDTSFEANDRIGLYICQKGEPLEVAGNYVNNTPLTFSGTQWNAEKPIYWNNGTYNIYGYYPYAASITSIEDYPFEVQTDQRTDGYAASDFLWAKKEEATASAGAVQLGFKHCMSRMVIKLVKGEDYEGELPDDAEVLIHNTVPSATVDLQAGIVTRNTHGTAQTIRAKSLGEHKYTAIIVPQRLSNRQPLVEVIMKGVSYLYESKFQFKAGMQHNVQLAVSQNPEQIKIDIGGEIEQWD